ncbi:MAG: HAMP domain-containing protein [Elusimicrobiota bacterium]|nr:MAG: HAMP domain-containing protein [Elusimicrobiota bacterium]
MKREPLGRHWTYSQVFSAVVAAGLGGAAVENALVPVFVKSMYAAGAEPPDVLISAEAGWLLAVTLGFWVAIWLWLRPVSKFLSDGRADLRDLAYRRFNGTYRFVAALYAAEFLLGLLLLVVKPETAVDWRACFARQIGPGLIATYYKVYFAVLYLEPLFFTKAAARFHDEESLFAAKDGIAISLRARLFLMVLNLIVIPLAILAVSLRLPKPENAVSNNLIMIVFILAYAIGYSEMLYRGVAAPLTALIEKMKAVRAGDYTQRTIVLGGDEIGQLKAHFNEMVDGLAERERLKDTFGRYVSVEIAKRLMESGRDRLGGESIEATILFSDIRDFTAMSERMTPQELVTFLNSYFSAVTLPISEHRGVINKFIGDAVMVIFCPQFGSLDHAKDGVEAALAMERALAEFNAGRSGKPTRFGVGLHSGLLVAGNIGTEKRLEYTVIGDTVNTASRIESLNKDLDSTILLSDQTLARLPEGIMKTLRLEKCEGVKMKGKNAAITVYKVGILAA